MARRISIAEEDLVTLLRNKDQKGFNILYNNYSGALFGVINKIVQSDDDASDLLQDTFLKIWRNIDNYDSSKGSIFTWMMNIARNLSIDKVRSADYRDSSQNVSMEDSVIFQVDSEYQTNLSIDAIGLRKIVDGLRPEYKQLIDLVYFQGYTQAEVSDEFGIPLGTVKTRIKAAIGNLRNLLGVLWLVLSYLFL
ncbi:RNA polymerase, sigma-24 subunit, ECF subfamily [Emticicia oligotrophica DSM 17448]|uniref:RNA polymerase, sigma-24 subunit, ECF subfamily n=1 Tax=Emticicia oligotrophica (strain DSM 17448 / CIP 109782 / MTCC 6937 / GPTSA100-15) TaxID=929562 RepID=A0ABM5N2X7_EMTOG|nr:MULTISPECIES: sigma-70 family RNA polymerase sigma factor [Emticicia]AFK03812.1 RNA polymerase, sigma-24 subunit, ECF subfamily [Emticicia oligotrophica DSM 17448]